MFAALVTFYVSSNRHYHDIRFHQLYGLLIYSAWRIASIFIHVSLSRYSKSFHKYLPTICIICYISISSPMGWNHNALCYPILYLFTYLLRKCVTLFRLFWLILDYGKLLSMFDNFNLKKSLCKFAHLALKLDNSINNESDTWLTGNSFRKFSVLRQ